MISLAVLSWVLWFLGYPDQALQRGNEAFARAQTFDHPMTLALVLMYLAGLHLFRHEAQLAQQSAEALIRLAAEQGFTARGTQGTLFRVLALLSQGKDEGLAEIEPMLNTSRVTGFEVLKPHYIAALAEWYAKSGQIEQGLNLLAEGLAMVGKSDNRVGESELYRLKGELLVLDDREPDLAPATRFAEAEACFRQAIKVARQQQAKSFELRATTSLCRLWQAQGKRAEAHSLLAAIYSWFTEGFETADLIAAKTLLEVLA